MYSKNQSLFIITIALFKSIVCCCMQWTFSYCSLEVFSSTVFQYSTIIAAPLQNLHSKINCQCGSMIQKLDISFLCCCNKLLKIQLFKATQIYFFTVLKVENPNLRVLIGLLLYRGPRRIHFLIFFSFRGCPRFSHCRPFSIVKDSHVVSSIVCNYFISASVTIYFLTLTLCLPLIRTLVITFLLHR